VKRKRTGLSIYELLFVLLLAGLLAAVSIPRLPMGAIGKQSVKAVSRQAAADLRWTRQLALADAAVNPSGYELLMEGAEPYSGYSVRNCQNGQTLSQVSFPSGLECTGGKRFWFGPLGNLQSGSGSQIQIWCGESKYVIMVIPATGAVLCRKDG
jgi:hypothetical protein